VAVGLGNSLLVAYHSSEVVLENEDLMGAGEHSPIEPGRGTIVLDRVQVGGSETRLEQYLGMLHVLCSNCCLLAAVRVDLVCLSVVVAAALIDVEVSLEKCPLPLRPHSVSDCLKSSRNFLVGGLLLGYMDPKWCMSFHRAQRSWWL
jgi:hypothetical protein